MGKEFEQYEHHDEIVYVRTDLKGKHRSYCLCHSCKKLHPNKKNNCNIAKKLFNICKEFSLVTAVFECPKFKENK